MPIDPQYGISKILRPYNGFATDYQGLSASSVAIMLTQDGKSLDPLAGTPGYSKALLGATEVPLGARILLWLPQFIARTDTSFLTYNWGIVWRLRNTGDYRRERGPYHFPTQSAGVSDTSDPTNPTRLVKPAAWQSLTFNEAEPGANTPAVNTVRPEQLQVTAFNAQWVAAVRLPDGTVTTGQTQSGMRPSTSAGYTIPQFTTVEVRAAGDEMLLAVHRAQSDAYPTWDLAAGGVDADLGSFFSASYPKLGAYLHYGVAT